jgi:hypothetical protein
MRTAKSVGLDVATRFAAVHESGCGPRLPTWLSQEVVSYLGDTGCHANILREAGTSALWSR